MVAVAQLVRASDCGSEGRGFETHQSPTIPDFSGIFFIRKLSPALSKLLIIGCVLKAGIPIFRLYNFMANRLLICSYKQHVFPFYRYFWFND